MSSEQRVPRRRVRTGCLTCRGRRRKCDEARPICENCRGKNLACRYGVKITFVTPRGEKLLQEGITSGPQISNVHYETVATTPSRSTNWERFDAVAGHTSSVDSTQTSVSAHQLQETNHEGEILEDNVDGNGAIHDDGEDGEDIIHEDIVPESSTIELVRSNEHRHIQMAPRSELQMSLWQPQPNLPTPTHDVINVRDEVQEGYELELLAHYRYKLAPVLDLEIGNLVYGVQALLSAKESQSVYRAILSVASYHRAATNDACRELDENTSTQTDREVFEARYLISGPELFACSVMMTIKLLLVNHPSQWLEKIYVLAPQLLENNINPDDRPLLARFVLGAVLMTTSHQRHSDVIHFFLDDISNVFGGVDSNHPQYELQAALTLLGQSLRFLPGVIRPTTTMLQAWQLCWRKLGDWYANRCVEMQEILQLSGANDISLHEGRIFPFILFSNACATVANIVHHLTAMLMLRNKPRLVKSRVRHDSSMSMIWHSERILGIAQVAVDAGLWDPLVVAAVIHAARRLSHDDQRRSAVQILENITKISGMKLDTYIDELRLLESM